MRCYSHCAMQLSQMLFVHAVDSSGFNFAYVNLCDRLVQPTMTLPLPHELSSKEQNAGVDFAMRLASTSMSFISAALECWTLLVFAATVAALMTVVYVMGTTGRAEPPSNWTCSSPISNHLILSGLLLLMQTSGMIPTYSAPASARSSDFLHRDPSGATAGVSGTNIDSYKVFTVAGAAGQWSGARHVQ